MTAPKRGKVRRSVFGLLFTALMIGGAFFLVMNDRYGWWEVSEGMAPLLFLGWAFACMMAMFLLWWLYDRLLGPRDPAAGGDADPGRDAPRTGQRE